MAEAAWGDSVAQLQKRVAMVKAANKKRALTGLRASTRLILNESNAQVPHEEGDFERGGTASVDGELMAGAVSYRDTAYAGQSLDLHEDLEMQHDAGRNAKFLERAMVACADRVRAILGKNMRLDI